jgi:hypothetical protein
MPCGSCKIQCFGGTYHLHHQGDKNWWARNNVGSNCNMLQLLAMAMLFLAHQFLSTWRWRWYFPPKRQFLQKPHGVTFQKTAFIVTTMKTSNVTSPI